VCAHTTHTHTHTHTHTVDQNWLPFFLSELFYWTPTIIMHRRTALFTAAPLRGRPWKNHKAPIAVHQAQRPPQKAKINFDELHLKYPLTQPINFIVARTGSSPQPEKPPANLPFHVDRTILAKELPVYTDVKHGKTKVITMIRRISGDVEELRQDMARVCGKEVRVAPGQLIVDGNYVLRLKYWLTGLGF
jgi:hypothetical protein